MDRAGKTGDAVDVRFLEEPREQIRLTVAQPQARRRRTLAERRDVHAPDDHVAASRDVLEREINADVALERYCRRDVHIAAAVLVLVRAQRIHAGAAGGDRRIAGRDDWNLLPEAQRDLRALRAAQLRL